MKGHPENCLKEPDETGYRNLGSIISAAHRDPVVGWAALGAPPICLRFPSTGQSREVIAAPRNGRDFCDPR